MAVACIDVEFDDGAKATLGAGVAPEADAEAAHPAASLIVSTASDGAFSGRHFAFTFLFRDVATDGSDVARRVAAWLADVLGNVQNIARQRSWWKLLYDEACTSATVTVWAEANGDYGLAPQIIRPAFFDGAVARELRAARFTARVPWPLALVVRGACLSEFQSVETRLAAASDDGPWVRYFGMARSLLKGCRFPLACDNDASDTFVLIVAFSDGPTASQVYGLVAWVADAVAKLGPSFSTCVCQWEPALLKQYLHVFVRLVPCSDLLPRPHCPLLLPQTTFTVTARTVQDFLNAALPAPCDHVCGMGVNAVHCPYVPSERTQTIERCMRRVKPYRQSPIILA